MKKIHVYPHTHWDYEWYFTSNESIIQLVYHMYEVTLFYSKNPLVLITITSGFLNYSCIPLTKLYSFWESVSLITVFLKLSSINSFAIVLNIFKWFSAPSSGIVSAKAVVIFFPSNESHSIGFLNLIKNTPGEITVEFLLCGIAIPSLNPVVASFSLSCNPW